MDQLRGQERLAGAGREHGQQATITRGDCRKQPLDRDMLVVPGFLDAGSGQNVATVGGLEQPNAELIELPDAAVVLPELLRAPESIDLVLGAGRKIHLDDPPAVRGIHQRQIQQSPVLLDLLYAGAFVPDGSLDLDQRDRMPSRSRAGLMEQREVGIQALALADPPVGDHPTPGRDRQLARDCARPPIAATQRGQHEVPNRPLFADRMHQAPLVLDPSRRSPQV